MRGKSTPEKADDDDEDDDDKVDDDNDGEVDGDDGGGNEGASELKPDRSDTKSEDVPFTSLSELEADDDAADTSSPVPASASESTSASAHTRSCELGFDGTCGYEDACACASAVFVRRCFLWCWLPLFVLSENAGTGATALPALEVLFGLFLLLV